MWVGESCYLAVEADKSWVTAVAMKLSVYPPKKLQKKVREPSWRVSNRSYVVGEGGREAEACKSLTGILLQSSLFSLCKK